MPVVVCVCRALGSFMFYFNMLHAFKFHKFAIFETGMEMQTKLGWVVFVVVGVLCSCKSNIHDDARALAGKKCDLIWTADEYKRVQSEFMSSMRTKYPVVHDSSKAGMGGGSGDNESAAKRRELSDRMEYLNDKMRDLNKEIQGLEEDYYKKYNEQDMGAISRDVKAQGLNASPRGNSIF